MVKYVFAAKQKETLYSGGYMHKRPPPPPPLKKEPGRRIPGQNAICLFRINEESQCGHVIPLKPRLTLHSERGERR
jgi:hypothetical protein